MISVLFARTDSIYKQLGCDVWDIDRDARKFNGKNPVIAHPPCRAWGRLRTFANPRDDEKDLAFFAVEQVRRCGGILEHPAKSTLWAAAGLPLPGATDEFGGITLGIKQSDFGHRAEKNTWLYICGLRPQDLPTPALVMGLPSFVVQTSLPKTNPRWRPSISKAEREHTPRPLAEWLIKVAKCTNLTTVKSEH